MVKYLLALAVVYSCSSYSHSVYSRASECHVDERSAQSVQVTYRALMGSFSDDELITQTKEKLLHKLQDIADNTDAGIMETAVSFKRDPNSSNIDAIAQIASVTECYGDRFKITKENIDYLSSTVFKYTSNDLDIETSFTLPAAPLKQLQQLTPTLILTEDSIFTFKMGDEFAQVLEKLGRFTMLWPINDTKLLAFIGRNHVFSFHQGKLVGYQYNQALLPISLANQLEIVAEDFTFSLNGAQFASTATLDGQQAALIDSAYSDPKFLTLQQVSDLDETAQKLAGFSVGKPFTDFSKVQTSPCYQHAMTIDEYISTYGNSLIQLVDADNKRAFFTPCRQKIVMSTAEQVDHIKLMEDFSARRAGIYGKNELFDTFSKWQFAGLGQGDPYAKLEAMGNANLEWDTAYVTTEKWHGQFLVIDDTLISGKVFH
ncbi:hypothetical protein EXT46_06990 [Pseudoalteromonas sp. CO325X]|uniref:hypothetical protein n=1 Tax=Pseudoalteromonas sp. CO325X TaxID=1777262 RepID=UPI0010236121|nr:hypothetical protein [Pseudoalteromonas sp. CO325X]RZF83186.1 hypothetical protein EXT46_06990 [Pseudoalteromonas sp. CO325X]